MKAMILAAGRGNRLSPLTDKLPKPLVKVGKSTLIEHHIKKCAEAGFESIIINTAHLGKQIQDHLGDGSRFNIPILYSDEGERALETAGGIAYALPLLGDQPFIAISSDIYCDISFNAQFQINNSQMHLIMVNNPEHHPQGDFTAKEINLNNANAERYTYSGIAYINPGLFTYEKKAYPLVDVIKQCINNDSISSELHTGLWMDVGTASRLHAANKHALYNR